MSIKFLMTESYVNSNSPWLTLSDLKLYYRGATKASNILKSQEFSEIESKKHELV